MKVLKQIAGDVLESLAIEYFMDSSQDVEHATQLRS